MTEFGQIIKLFESFIKRGFFPSISFFFIFFVQLIIFLNIYSESSHFTFNKDFESFLFTNNLFVMGLILFIGMSIFLSILHQLIYDNFIKYNYNLICKKFSLNTSFLILRNQVIKKLKINEKNSFVTSKYINDYLLYQYLGRKLSYYSKETKTSRYVDETKTIGIFFTSTILSLIILSYLFEIYYTLIICIPIYYIGYETIKAKYRSRAVRIYINYLIGEHK